MSIFYCQWPERLPPDPYDLTFWNQKLRHTPTETISRHVCAIKTKFIYLFIYYRQDVKFPQMWQGLKNTIKMFFHNNMKHAAYIWSCCSVCFSLKQSPFNHHSLWIQRVKTVKSLLLLFTCRVTPVTFPPHLNLTEWFANNGHTVHLSQRVFI